MKSFLLNSQNTPIIRWSLLENGIFYQGEIPKGFGLAICPTNERQVILDVDVKNGKNGFNYIPSVVLAELELTFNYSTKSGGHHYFLNYSGSKLLMNTSTSKGLDLRIGANKKTKNAGGYCKYNGNIPVEQIEPLIKKTSPRMNLFLEKLFT